MNDQDYKDYSKWSHFFNEETVFASIAVLVQMQLDIEAELLERKTEKDNAS